MCACVSQGVTFLFFNSERSGRGGGPGRSNCRGAGADAMDKGDCQGALVCHRCPSVRPRHVSALLWHLLEYPTTVAEEGTCCIHWSSADAEDVKGVDALSTLRGDQYRQEHQGEAGKASGMK